MEWQDRDEVGLPPENEWVEVKGYFGLKWLGKGYQGRARWYWDRDVDKEFFFWQTENGQEYGSWYLCVEQWRGIVPVSE